MTDIRTTFFEETMPGLAFTPSADMDLKRENGNINGESPMGVMLRYGSEAGKAFYKTDENLLTREAAEAHEAGDIHIHDLDFNHLTTTCCQIDLGAILARGFDTGHGSLRPPSNIGTAAAQACIVIQSNQNDQHGGQSIPAFDYALAPYVARSFIRNLCYIVEILGDYDVEVKTLREELLDWVFPPKGGYNSILGDKGQSITGILLMDRLFLGDIEEADDMISKAWLKTEQDTFQAMEALVHNLNTMHSRAGAQVPFSSINYGTDIMEEGRMVVRCILNAEDAGLGHGETPIFPIHIFKVRKGYNLNPDDPNYDLFKLACKVSAKRLFPNFSFMDAPFNAEFLRGDDPNHEVAYMGCRTRVMANRYDKSRETTFGRGNLSFTSINLPRLGLKHRGDVEGFFSELDDTCRLVFRQLAFRLKLQGERLVRNAPFLMGQGVWLDSDKLDSDERIAEVLKHGTLTVGFIGLAECLTALIGKHHAEDEGAQHIGIAIVKRIRELADQEGERTGLNYTVIATPAEGLSGRFVAKDKKVFGEIPGVTDKEYYTNSFHVPVSYPITAFKKISIEAPYHELTNGGHITYVEVDGDPLNNLQAFEDIVRYMAVSGIGYGSINHPVDHDPVCGYTGVIGDTCPKCGRQEKDGRKFERIRRITGYLVGTLDRFNNAKAAEERDRVKHATFGIKEI